MKPKKSFLHRIKASCTRFISLLVLPLITACSGSGYSVSGGKSDAQAIVREIHPVIRPFFFALSILAIGYNAFVIILGPAASGGGDEAIAVARRRLITVISAVIAYGLLYYLFTGDLI